MGLRLVAKIVCCSLAIAACAPLQPKLQERQTPPQKVVQQGYSLVPPNEKGWLVVVRNQHQLALAKLGANPDETIAIQARSLKIPEFKTTEEFIQIIKEGQARDTDPQRFTIKKHDVADYKKKKGYNCTKSHIVTEDNAAVKRSGSSGNMILEALTLACAQPQNKSTGISVTYSHRHYPGQGDAAFISKATSVLDSVEFNDL